MRQIFLAGDSTVVDRDVDKYEDCGVCHTGWGQMLPLYLGTEYKVKNFAMSGRTTDSFRNEGHFDKILNNLNDGDYVLFQFGHNDQKLDELLANGRYKENLITYIKEINERKAIPILVTPMGRNSWNCNTGEYNDLLKEYAEVVKEVGKQTETVVIDLHEMSIDWIRKLGREGVKPYFLPGDFTHTNDYGEYEMASFVAEKLLEVIKPKQRELAWNSECESKIPSNLFEDSERLVTRLEALEIVGNVCSYFAYAETIKTNREKEVIIAEQNGFLTFDDELENLITEKEFVELLVKGYSGRELIPVGLFTSVDKYKNQITRNEVLKYVQMMENEIHYTKNRKGAKILGA